MDRDTLLQKFSDGELSESERFELNRLMETDEEFASEVRSLSTLEKNLDKLRTTITFRDVDFINQLGQGLSTVNATAIAGKTSGMFAKMLAKLTMIQMSVITSAAVITGGTGVYLYEKAQDESAKNNSAYEKIVSDENSQSQNPPVLINDVNTNDNFKVLNQEKIETQINNPVQIENKESKDELTLSIKQQNQIRNNELINDLKSELNRFVQNNDYLNVALTQKRLGVLIGQTGDFNSAVEYLTSSMNSAKMINNNYLEAEALGEIALIRYRAGFKDEAIDNLNQCIKILSIKKSERAEYWQNKLDKLN